MTDTILDFRFRRKPLPEKPRRRPEWIRRMQQQCLPPKDYTRPGSPQKEDVA